MPSKAAEIASVSMSLFQPEIDGFVSAIVGWPIAKRLWQHHLLIMTSQAEDLDFIERAIGMAQLAHRSGSGAPIGCILALNGDIIGQGENEVEATKDPNGPCRNRRNSPGEQKSRSFQI
jgi:hypothetical protein